MTALSQIMFTSTLKSEATPEQALEMSRESAQFCRQLKLTGVVLANNNEALAILEGPSDILKEYYSAVRQDPAVHVTVLHSEHAIEAREYSEFEIWLNSDQHVVAELGEAKILSAETMSDVLPKNPSTKLKIMVAAYL